ncbi:MAG: hypothetical protein NT002_13320 [candidate division Zixibacteria bacterium]|nr:hypothetical protein [candidate division Zixibacteria bacterium]
MLRKPWKRKEGRRQARQDENCHPEHDSGLRRWILEFNSDASLPIAAGSDGVGVFVCPFKCKSPGESFFSFSMWGVDPCGWSGVLSDGTRRRKQKQELPSRVGAENAGSPASFLMCRATDSILPLDSFIANHVIDNWHPEVLIRAIFREINCLIINCFDCR